MSTFGIATGIGAGVGVAAMVGTTIYGVKADHRAMDAADADWAASRPSRQPAIDEANAYVDRIAAKYDQSSAVHDEKGLHKVALYDPSGVAAKYLTSHLQDMPKYAYTNPYNYDGTYVSLETYEPSRKPVNAGGTVTAATMLAGIGVGVAGGALAHFAHGPLKVVGTGMAAAGAMTGFGALLGNTVMPESAIPW